jgi:hypothetical protein
VTAYPTVGQDPWDEDLQDYILSHGHILLNVGDDAGDIPAGTPADVLVLRKPDVTTWDFKNLGVGALPTGWTARGTSSSVTRDANGLAFTPDHGAGYEVAIPTNSDTFEMEIDMRAGASAGLMTGGLVSDAAGTGVGFGWLNSSAGLLAGSATSHTYNSSQSTLARGPSTGPAEFPIRYRLRRSKKSWRPAYSYDEGLTWTDDLSAAPINLTVTPTKLSIGGFFNSGAMKVAEVKFRNLSAPGGILGRWDGSAIQPF